MKETLIKSRSYVGCLYRGMALPLTNFSTMMVSLWPTFVAFAILGGISSMLASCTLRQIAFAIVVLLAGACSFLQVNVFMRKVLELGYVPRLTIKAMCQLLPSTKVAIRLRWKQIGKFLSVALMAKLTAVLVWVTGSLPLIIVCYLDFVSEQMLVEGDIADLPSSFPIIRFIAFAISSASVIFAWLLAIPCIAHAHGSIIDDEIQAKQVTEQE